MSPLLKTTSGGRQTSALSSIASTQGLVLGLRLFNFLIIEGEGWTDRQQPSPVKEMGDAKLRKQSTSGIRPSLNMG